MLRNAADKYADMSYTCELDNNSVNRDILKNCLSELK